MPIPEPFRDALRQGFACYFEVSELPGSWDEWSQEEFEEQAYAAASNILYWAKKFDISELVALIRAESQKQRGELVREIEGWTRFGWSRTEKDRAVLNRILCMIGDYLEQHAP